MRSSACRAAALPEICCWSSTKAESLSIIEKQADLHKRSSLCLFHWRKGPLYRRYPVEKAPLSLHDTTPTTLETFFTRVPSVSSTSCEAHVASEDCVETSQQTKKTFPAAAHVQTTRRRSRALQKFSSSSSASYAVSGACSSSSSLRRRSTTHAVAALSLGVCFRQHVVPLRILRCKVKCPFCCRSAPGDDVAAPAERFCCCCCRTDCCYCCVVITRLMRSAR